MAYTKTNWVDNQTPINASNLNKIENELSNLDNNVTNITKIQEMSVTIGSIGAQSGLYDKTLDITAVSGYTPIAVAGWSIAGGASASVNIARLRVRNNKIEYSLFNSATSGSSASTSILYIQVLYIKN